MRRSAGGALVALWPVRQIPVRLKGFPGKLVLAPDDAHVTRFGAPFHVALPGWRHTVTRPQVRRTLRWRIPIWPL